MSRPLYRWRIMALLCCALAFSASVESSVLLPVLAGVSGGTTFASWESSADEDDDEMLRPRTEREDKQAQPGRAPGQAAQTPTSNPHPPHPSTSPLPARAGGEHACRNGVGVPLLC
jgi:hypothetical protein